MWLLDYVTKNSLKKASPSCGDVTSTDTGTVAVSSSTEDRRLPVVAPYGIYYVPPTKEQAVVLPLDSGRVMLGVKAPVKDLQPGELMLFSSGNASIVLKNNGDVVINGKVFGG